MIKRTGEGFEKDQEDSDSTLSSQKKQGNLDAARLVEELQIHRIELEMQNEELRTAHTELEQAKSRYRTLFNLAPVGYIILDNKGIIHEVNLGACALLGCDKGSAHDIPFSSFIEPEDQDTFYFFLRELNENSKAESRLIRLLRSGVEEKRESFYSQITATSIDLPSEAEATLLVFSDITEQINTQKELELAKNEAESANMAKSRFLANMSHEIRTPMNGVLGMLELSLLSDLADEQKTQLRLAKSSAESLLDILNDILDISRFEAGKMTLEEIAFDLPEEIASTARLLTGEAEKKGLEFLFRIDPSLPKIMLGDPLRIKQIFFNLLSNAIKFTRKGDVVVEISGKPLEKGKFELTVSVHDTGVGIPEKAKEKLFKSFSQVDDATSRQYGGTGLGLAITSRLISMMHGSIAVTSMEGRGSTFTFSIELAVPEEIGETCDLPEKIEVYLYEPHKKTSDILGEYIQSFGAELTILKIPSAVERCCRKLQEGSKGVILLSPFLPDGSVFDFLQSRDWNVRGKIALLSYPMMERQLRDIISSSASFRYLTKPVSEKVLFSFLISFLMEEEHSQEVIAGQLPASEVLEGEDALEVLVAEDNDINLAVVEGMLKKAGWKVHSAVNGLQALEQFKQKQETLDLVLMDIEMPAMDGIEATRKIRALSDTGKRIPIIATTAYAMEQDRYRCLAAGMNGYIAKPVSSAADLLGYVRMINYRKRVHILLVDDEPLSRLYVSTRLSQEGFDVISVAKGEDCLSWIARKKPSLIITNDMLPDMDGSELLEKIHQSGYKEAVIVQSAKKIAENDFPSFFYDWFRLELVEKPLTDTVLMDRVKRVLDEPFHS